MNEIIYAIVLGVFGLASLGVLVWEQVRTIERERARHGGEIERLANVYDGERERLAARVQYLEFQLANHVAHVLHLPPPAPPIDNGPKPPPLPDIMVKFLEAIEGEEERSEFEQDFRAQMALGIEPPTIVSRALSAHA